MTSSHQHTPFSIWTNVSYGIVALIILIVDPILSLPVAISLYTLYAGSYWYHVSETRNTVTMDFFGMFITLGMIGLTNFLRSTVGLDLMVEWEVHKKILGIFVVIGIMVPFLKVLPNFIITGIFALMALTGSWLYLSSMQLFIIAIVFSIALLIRFSHQIKLFRDIKYVQDWVVNENEGITHGLWHIITAIGFGLLSIKIF